MTFTDMRITVRLRDDSSEMKSIWKHLERHEPLTIMTSRGQRPNMVIERITEASDSGVRDITFRELVP